MLQCCLIPPLHNRPLVRSVRRGVHAAALPWVSHFRPATGRPAFLGREVNGSLSQSWQLTSCKKNKKGVNNCWKKATLKAALPDDAPFAVAIGACLLSTLVLPVGPEDESKKENSLFGPDDMRSGAMQIISFIPLFNWLVWVFAWLDTGKPRYLAFAIIYLAPYLKTGLSLIPEDSWLPVASIVAGIVHVQLDISVSAEGSQPPLADFAKVLQEKTQVTGLRGRADNLVDRLKELAERTDVHSVDTLIQEDQQMTADWIAAQEEMQRNEFKEFDEKLARSEAQSVENVKESTKEIGL